MDAFIGLLSHLTRRRSFRGTKKWKFSVRKARSVKLTTLTDNEVKLIVAAAAAASAVVVALLSAFIARVFVGRDRRRQMYGEAFGAALEWHEMLYRVRRRDNTDEHYRAIDDKFHDLQERLAFHQGWIGSESEYMRRSYGKLVEASKSAVRSDIEAAWDKPGKKGNADKNDTNPTVDKALIDGYLRDVRSHLSLQPWRWAGVVWRNREGKETQRDSEQPKVDSQNPQASEAAGTAVVEPEQPATHSEKPPRPSLSAVIASDSGFSMVLIWWPRPSARLKAGEKGSSDNGSAFGAEDVEPIPPCAGTAVGESKQPATHSENRSSAEASPVQAEDVEPIPPCAGTAVGESKQPATHSENRSSAEASPVQAEDVEPISPCAGTAVGESKQPATHSENRSSAEAPGTDVGRHAAPPVHTPRLRLKPKAPPVGYVDGAWWPRSDDLTTQLPDLLAVLSDRLGPIGRVLYNLNEWLKAPAKLAIGGRAVRLDGYRLQPINTVEVVGLNRNRIVLLVVPPHTGPGQAHVTMMAAAGPNNASTVDGLLMVSVRDREIPH